MEKSEYLRYIEYGFTMLSDLNRYYKNADLYVKQKMLGSIFPDRLVFDKKNYRTTKLNLLLTLNELKINNLEDMPNKKADKNVGLSKLVVPTVLKWVIFYYAILFLDIR